MGSVAGVSNAQVAKLLGCPVLLVGSSGVGNALDTFLQHETYFRSFSAKVIGAVFNNIPSKVSYHTLQSSSALVKQFFSIKPPRTTAHYYGHIPRHEGQWKRKLDQSKDQEVCILRVPKKGLEMDEQEKLLCTELLKWTKKHFQVDLLLKDLGFQLP